ncbi:MAG TPA: CAP domain-containing protein [Ilumatobacter sp.]
MERRSRLVVAGLLVAFVFGGASIGVALTQRIDQAAEVGRVARRIGSPPETLTPDQRTARDLAATVNVARQQLGLPALMWHDQVGEAAVVHARDMANRLVMEHLGSDGSDAGVRLTAAGFAWIRWGEALAVGYRDIGVLVDAWLASPSHRPYLVGDYRLVGTAVATGADGRPYWVLVVAT